MRPRVFSSEVKGMSAADSPGIPEPNPEQRRIAAERFERANQVIGTGNYDYGIQLLLTCCKFDPINIVYRQALRRTQKAKFKNNMRGSRFALLSTSGYRARMKASKRSRDWLKVLEQGEEVLVRNPWDLGTQMDMAEAAEALGQPDLAIWILEQARQRDGQDSNLNRTLARMYERCGKFSQAIALWELVKQAEPHDVEAQHKGKDLAASETITRGKYDFVIHQKRPDDVPAEEETDDHIRNQDATDIAPTNDRVAREAAPLLAKIATGPGDPLPYLQLAAVYTRAGRYDEARDVLQNGLGPTGQHFQLRIELMELDLEPFRRNLAITEQKLENLPPPTGLPEEDAKQAEQEQEFRRIRVRLLKEINAREVDLYRLKADRFPNDMSHRIELGLRLMRGGQVDEAISELQQARKDPRQQWRALMFLGFGFKSRNNWRLAQRNFTEALEQMPANEEQHRKEVMFQLAVGHAEAGDLSTAIDLAHELANIDFSYRDISRLLDEWQEKLQQA
jgi:tetratricopeptide (TPR) repeat protein